MVELLGKWRELTIRDYPEALVRIATVRVNGKRYLLFAWVELFPFDMVVPAGWMSGEKPWSIPAFGGSTCAFSARKVSTADALEWYEMAARGEIDLAKGTTVEVVPLSAEPSYGEFCVGVETPFSFCWHNGARIHRYVPMTEVPLPVRMLGNSTPLRDWLKNNLGFDPFEHDEWLGGLALVAPDPVCSSVVIFPSARSEDGSEALTVYASPRRNLQRGVSDLSTLSIVVAEHRVSGWSSLHQIKFEGDGYCTIPYKQTCNQVGHAVICSRRGLLRFVEPVSWIKQAGVTINLVSSHRQVHVPSGGRRKPSASYLVENVAKGSDIVVGEAVSDAGRMRLFLLRERSRLREHRLNAAQQLFGVVSAVASAQEITKKRKEAEDFVSELVAGARKRVIFVDPYFGPREARLFALRNPRQEVTLKILTGLKGLEGDAPDVSCGTKLGDLFIADLDYLGRCEGVLPPQVRVMPGGDRATIHDRYLIVDDTVWHCGPSFNELGERLGVMVRLPDPLSVRRLVSKIWCRAAPLADFWTGFKER